MTTPNWQDWREMIETQENRNYILALAIFVFGVFVIAPLIYVSMALNSIASSLAKIEKQEYSLTREDTKCTTSAPNAAN